MASSSLFFVVDDSKDVNREALDRVKVGDFARAAFPIARATATVESGTFQPKMPMASRRIGPRRAKHLGRTSLEQNPNGF